MSANPSAYDVIIVGGGLVGLTMGLSLVRSMEGIRIALLDRRPFAPGGDARASAIAPAARLLLDTLGAWEHVASESEPVLAMQITDSGPEDMARPLFLRFEGEQSGGEPLAHMVQNASLVRALLTGLEGKADLIEPAEVVAISTAAGKAELTLSDGRHLFAPLVIAADGAQSALRRLAGIEIIQQAYGQSGIVTTISHELEHEGVAYEHFRPAGPFASLPLRGKRSSLVWTESSEAAQQYRSMAPVALAEIIEGVMGSCLGAVQVEEKVQVFPLGLLLAKDFVRPRLALIGDAAHVIHPIAGQGLNLGLKDVAALAEVVVETMRLGLDHGSIDVLERYQRWRRFDTSLMAGMTDGMNRLFSNDIAVLRAARDLGLSLVERLPPIKRGLVAAATGGSGGGPRLLEGRPI